MKNRKKTADGYERWMMKAATTGAAAFGEVVKLDDKESGGGSGRGRKKTGDDDEGNASDRGDEDEEDESSRKSKLGLNKRGGDDDDDEAPRGRDADMDEDEEEKGEYILTRASYSCDVRSYICLRLTEAKAISITSRLLVCILVKTLFSSCLCRSFYNMYFSFTLHAFW